MSLKAGQKIHRGANSGDAKKLFKAWSEKLRGFGRSDFFIRYLQSNGMNKLLASIATFAFFISGISQSESLASEKGPFAVFFAVHMEAVELSKGKYQEGQWPNLVKLVKMADRYGAKLTLMFNPQWAEYILKDKTKFELLKDWQKMGHEIAMHYHNVFHSDWNGYTNRLDKKYTDDPRYRGTVEEMMKLLHRISFPDKTLTMCMGPKKNSDSASQVEIDEVDYPQGIIYDVDGVNAGLGRILTTEFKDREIFQLKHHSLLPERRGSDLKGIQSEFEQAKPLEVLGVVTHEGDFGKSPPYIEEWFKFAKSKNVKMRTVRDIVENYPKEALVHTHAEHLSQEEDTNRHEMNKEIVLNKVGRLHRLIQEKKMKGIDTSEAQRLDAESRYQAKDGNLEQTEKLLDEAIRLLE